MHTLVKPDVFAVAATYVAESIDHYRRGLDYSARFQLPEGTLAVDVLPIWEKDFPWADDNKRIGSTISVESSGVFQGRYESDMLTLAVEEHGPDWPLSSSEFVPFFEKLTTRGVWSEEAEEGKTTQTLNSCELPECGL